MALILVVDDEPSIATVFQNVLAASGHQVRVASRASEAIELLAHVMFDCIVCDLKLPDRSGLEVLRFVRNRLLNTRFVIVTGYGSISDGAEAVRLGGDVLQKPVTPEQLLDAVQKPPTADIVANEDVPCAHAAERWARLVLLAILSRSDPKTLRAWAVAAKTSPGALRNWCHTLGVPAKRSLNLARMFRAWFLCRQFGVQPENALDIADTRTLKKLLGEAGLLDCFPDTVDELLKKQQLIRDETALAQLTRLWSERPLRPVSGPVSDSRR